MAQSRFSSLKTYEAFGWVVLVSTAVLVAMFISFSNDYAEHGDSPNQLTPVTASHIRGAFAPLVVATLVGYRSLIFRVVPRPGAPARRAIKIQSGIKTLYAFALTGIAAAAWFLVSLRLGWVRRNVDWLTLGCSSVWAGTLLYSFDNYIRGDEAATDSRGDEATKKKKKTKADKRKPDLANKGTDVEDGDAEGENES